MKKCIFIHIYIIYIKREIKRLQFDIIRFVLIKNHIACLNLIRYNIISLKVIHLIRYNIKERGHAIISGIYYRISPLPFQ